MALKRARKARKKAAGKNIAAAAAASTTSTTPKEVEMANPELAVTNAEGVPHKETTADDSDPGFEVVICKRNTMSKPVNVWAILTLGEHPEINSYDHLALYGEHAKPKISLTNSRDGQ